VTPGELEGYLARRRAQVERALAALLARHGGRPPALGRAMRYAVLGPGKRVRPILTLAAAEAVGGRAAVPRALPFACAVEMIHAYSLVHDDLPAMDDDALRRGRPTLHVRFGEALAILAGDALLTEAFVVMSAAPRGPVSRAQASLSLAVIAEMALAAGADGMIAGQVVDLANEGKRVGLAAVTAVHRRKTGALIRAAVRAGALVGAAKPRELRALTAYGEALGLAFQIADDILDETGSEAVTGKHAGGDRAHGKSTYLSLLGIEGARGRICAVADRAQRAIAPLGSRAAPLGALVRRVVARAA
jgi:geranylgeranyl diphosphate synthase type II